MLLITILFIVARLETAMDKEGISVRFFPFHRHFRQYKWEEISHVFIRKYNPLGEYGGWGIRFGIGGKKAFNVSGNKGIQLTFINGSRLFNWY